MPLAPNFANNLMQLIFESSAYTIANIADNPTGLSTAPLTNLWLSLHTAQPSSDNQTASEAGYTNYVRQAVARSAAGFTATLATSQGSGVTISPLATISFPQATSGSSAETEAYFSIGKTSAGTTGILFSGTISPSLVIGPNVTPRLTTGTMLTLT